MTTPTQTELLLCSFHMIHFFSIWRYYKRLNIGILLCHHVWQKNMTFSTRKSSFSYVVFRWWIFFSSPFHAFPTHSQTREYFVCLRLFICCHLNSVHIVKRPEIWLNFDLSSLFRMHNSKHYYYYTRNVRFRCLSFGSNSKFCWAR